VGDREELEKRGPEQKLKKARSEGLEERLEKKTWSEELDRGLEQGCLIETGRETRGQA